jgi:hypothetical protein
MDHDDDIPALLERQPVAGLLVGSVVEVSLMDMDSGQGKIPSNDRLFIMAHVIHKDHV